MDYVTTAQLISIPVTLSLAGYQFCLSSNVIPSIYDQPSSSTVKVFMRTYHLGAQTAVPSALLCGALNGFVAYHTPEQRALWIAAAGMVVAIMPFTAITMLPGITRLQHLETAAAEREKAERSGEVRTLLKGWVNRNWVRFLLTGGSGVLALWATMNRK